MKKFKILLSGFLVALVIAGATLGVCLGTKNNVKEDNSPLVISTIDSENTGVFLSVGEAVASADGTTSQTLTATVAPAESARLSFQWTVAFKNPSSSWANGKNVTDYVTVTKDSSNDLVATVTFKKRFSEQIIVSVFCPLSPNVKASATVDCYKEVTDVAITLANPKNVITLEGLGRDPVVSVVGDFLPYEYTVTISPVYGDGTITAESKIALQLDVGADSTDRLEVSSGGVLEVEGAYEHAGLTVGSRYEIEYFYNGVSMAKYGLLFVVTPNSISISNASITF